MFTGRKETNRLRELKRKVMPMVERSLKEIDFDTLCHRPFHPSPAAWEDEVFYFLLLDRFSDGQEQGYRDNDGQIVASGATPLFQPGDENEAILTPQEAARWREAGGKWAGGTLKGLTSKIGYLQRLGVTALWASLGQGVGVRYAVARIKVAPKGFPVLRFRALPNARPVRQRPVGHGRF